MRTSWGILLVIATMCVACGGNNQNAQTLRIAFHDDPPTLEPQKEAESLCGTIESLLFDGLLRIGKNGKPVAAAAESWEISPDEKRYTFNLRDSQWSNGDPVSAHDFVAGWRRTVDPKFASHVGVEMYVIKNARAIREGNLPATDLGVTAVDERTLVVDLEHPCPYFLDLVTVPWMVPINRVAAQSSDWHLHPDTYISNGPFLLEEWDPSYRITLQKNPSYWNSGEVKLDQIEISVVPSSTTALSMFLNRELDWVGAPFTDLPHDVLPDLKKNHNLKINPAACSQMLLFNPKIEPFSNKKFRRALAAAINRNGITAHLFHSTQIPSSRFIPDTLIPAPLESIPVDTQLLFKEALEELGTTVDELGPITIATNHSDYFIKMCEEIQEDWRQKFGLDVRIETAEWKVHIGRLTQGEFQVGRIAYFSYIADPLPLLEQFEVADNPYNPGSWESSKYAALLRQARQALDKTKRLNLLAEAEAILLNEAPIAPIFHHTNPYLCQPEVQGVVMSELGRPQFMWAWKELS